MHALQKAVSGRQNVTVFGMDIADLDWNSALARAETLASTRVGSATLAFVDESRLVAALFASSATAMLRQRSLLLSTGGILVRLLLRAMGGKGAFQARFPADLFVSALITYLPGHRRIAIAGTDTARIDALTAHFARHAPWHDVMPFSSAGNLSGRFDILIVDAVDRMAERRVMEQIAGADASLVILAGSGLSRYVNGNPASVEPPKQISTPAAA
ncbi:hypothetical protein [Neorhizobium sp. NCHU2750]|uniref:hypothetical protein n=1 Tax=Neorhizobium sp. NCHU2750 TaxID=1825976 RepID=UPI000EB652F5|nr:hypothetical protein NCHU2750_02950 [Neorhizobium sp. NCHU2750]